MNSTPKEIMSSEKTGELEKNTNETWTPQERELLRSRYGCEVLKHNCTLKEAQITDVPTDAYIVTYVIGEKVCYDLTRCGSKRVNLFDMYYDSLGPVIRSIDWGYGKISPKMWGYQAPEKKRRK